MNKTVSAVDLTIAFQNNRELSEVVCKELAFLLGLWGSIADILDDEARYHEKVNGTGGTLHQIAIDMRAIEDAITKRTGFNLSRRVNEETT